MGSLRDLFAEAFEGARPKDYMNVVEAGEKYNYIRQANSFTGFWSRELTPYLVEPQVEMTSLDFTSVVFQGPARTGKSMMLNNLMAYAAMVDPHDLMTVHSEQHKARDWSLDDLAKFLRHSKEVRGRLMPGRKNDNTYDKSFRQGHRITLTWPTVANLSGKTVPWHWLLDYDRMDDSIEKEGNAFDLTRKRGTTFKRFAMTVAESSPGRLIANPRWIAKTPHEGPPVTGIGGLYNLGDRRRLYWECVQCHEAFEAHHDYFDWPGKADPKRRPSDNMEAAEQTVVVCPSCGMPHTSEMKEDLNHGCTWVKDGMIWVPAEKQIRVINGMKPARTKIASFAMFGPAAAFQTWTDIVLNYLNAEDSYESTGDEEPLKKVYNTDFGAHYTLKAMRSDRSPELLKEKAEDWGATKEMRTVPADVRFLIATVDVQARSNAGFVFQVHGFTADGDIIVVDSDRLLKSDRFDEEGDRLRLDPASFPEDWDVLIEHIIERTYPLADASGRRMAIKMVGCDSGGAEGVTLNAYKFWRRLKNDELKRGYHRKFVLVKGGSNDIDKQREDMPPTRDLWPDANRKDRNSGAIGDTPVLEINRWMVKDRLANMLVRRIKSAPGEKGGAIRFPTWIPNWFYEQITTEVRTTKGWENVIKKRNESWDTLVYALAIAVRRREHPNDPVTGWPTINIDKIDWTNPPPWAEVWDKNELIIWPEGAQKPNGPRKNVLRASFKDLGENLA